jgi:hypothetical protein
VGGDPSIQPLNYERPDRRGYSGWDIAGVTLALISGAIAVTPWWFVWEARREAGLWTTGQVFDASTGISISPIFYVIALAAVMTCFIALRRGCRKLTVFALVVSLAAVGATIIVTSRRW